MYNHFLFPLKTATKQEIISQLFISKNFTDCINKFDQPHLREDLRQEVALIICGWPDDRIVELHKRNELNFYVARVILNQMKSNTSPFYHTYRKVSHSYEEIEWDEDGNNNNKAVNKHVKNIQNEASRKLYNQTGKVHERPVEDSGMEDRVNKELLEDFTLEQINYLPFYESEMVKLYMKAGSYRSMEKMTRIPHESCHKTVRKALQKLKNMAEIKKAAAVFTKEELKFIQNHKHK